MKKLAKVMDSKRHRSLPNCIKDLNIAMQNAEREERLAREMRQEVARQAGLDREKQQDVADQARWNAIFQRSFKQASPLLIQMRKLETTI